MIANEERFRRSGLAALLALRAEAALLRPGSDAAGAEVALLAVAVAGEVGYRGGTKERRAMALAGWLLSSHLLLDSTQVAPAAETLYLALHFAAEPGPSEEQALVFSGLAHLNEAAGLFDEAVVEYRRASDTFRQLGGDASPQAACLAEAGFLLLDMDALVLARRTLQEAFRRLDPAFSPSLAVRLANACAEAQARAEKPAMSDAWQQRAERLARLPAAPGEEIRRQWSEGRIAAAMGRHDLARTRLDAVSAELIARGSLAEAVRCVFDQLVARAGSQEGSQEELQADDPIAPLTAAFGPPAAPWAESLGRLALQSREGVAAFRQARVDLLLRLRRERPAAPAGRTCWSRTACSATACGGIAASTRIRSARRVMRSQLQRRRREPAASIPRRRATPLGIALTWLREGRGWTRRVLAEVSGIATNQISDYERGNRAINRTRLTELTAVMGYGPDEVELVLLTLSRIGGPSQGTTAEGAAEGPSGPPAESVCLGEQAALRLAIELGSLTTSLWLPRIVLRQLAEDRAQAGRLWRRLQRRSAAERRALVEHAAEFQTWALAERLAQESRRAGARNAQVALELARLAVLAAQHAAGSDAWRSRLEGYVRAFLANAFRLAGDLPRARAEWETAWRLWHAGAEGDPHGLLPAWHLLDLEASLRRDTGELAAALDLLARAAAAAPRPAVGRLRLQRVATLEQAGDVAGAVAALRQAVPLVEATGEPRLQFVLEFNLTANLCQLAAFDEAAAQLPTLRQRTLDLGDELDLLRVAWLSGRVAAGLGRSEEACAIFDQVRCEWRARRAPLDAAVASLDLAVLLLDEGQLAPVRRLAQEMEWILAAPGVDSEALASLRPFCDAARRQAATVEQARTLLRQLDRSDHQLRTTATRWRLPPPKPT
jgi:transcriptional regulator with XRE-family HTH domain